MNSEEFTNLSYGELASLTGIDRSNWCRYINDKQSMTERTLKRIARALCMTPIELLEAIDEKRRKTLNHVVDSTNNYYPKRWVYYRYTSKHTGEF